MNTLHYADFDRFEIVDKPIPEYAPDEVLLHVSACGICGSELEGVKSRSPRRLPPLVMGHEFCGEIVALGSEVSGYRVGQKVVSNALVTCGTCRCCLRGDTNLCPTRQVFGMNRFGAWSEYVNAPARSLFVWPENLTAEAACLAEPLGNGVHVAELVKDQQPKTAVIIGAGPIGLMCQQTLQLLGARTVVSDLSPERLAVAMQLGAVDVVQAGQGDLKERVLQWTDGEGVDVVVDAAGSAFTRRLSVTCTRYGGTAVWIGLHENAMQLDAFDVTLGERRIQGSYATNSQDMQAALDLMAAGKVDVTSWTQRWPLVDGVEAFWRMMRAQGNDIKAVLVP